MDDKKLAKLDKEIQILQDQVVAKYEEYNELKGKLAELLDERYPERKTDRIKDALYRAYMKSSRPLDEIIDLIQNCDEYI